MRLSAMVFRVLKCPYLNNLKLVKVPSQVVFGEIMHRAIRFTFEGVWLCFFTLSEGRLFIRKNREKSEPPRFQFAKTLLQEQFSFLLTKKVQNIEAIDGIIPGGYRMTYPGPFRCRISTGGSNCLAIL